LICDVGSTFADSCGGRRIGERIGVLAGVGVEGAAAVGTVLATLAVLAAAAAAATARGEPPSDGSFGGSDGSALLVHGEGRLRKTSAERTRRTARGHHRCQQVLVRDLDLLGADGLTCLPVLEPLLAGEHEHLREALDALALLCLCQDRGVYLAIILSVRVFGLVSAEAAAASARLGELCNLARV
jgi:hypothetical protein